MYISYYVQYPSYYGYFRLHQIPTEDDEFMVCSESELFVGTLEELLA